MPSPVPCGWCGACDACHHAAHDARFAARFGGLPAGFVLAAAPAKPATPAPAAKPPAAPCRWGPEELTQREKESAGLDRRKAWKWCDHPALPLRGEKVVCSCRGCGPSCPGYSA